MWSEVETIVEIAIGVAIFIFGFKVLVIRLGYHGTAISISIREALNNLKQVERCATDADKVTKSASTELEKQVQTFIKIQKISRLNTTPLESLKEAGALNIRWAALRQAGFTTLVEIIAADKRKLMSIPGVGQATAERVIRAARSLAAQINAKEPSPPSADLTEPQSIELAARTLHLLHTKDLLNGASRQLNTDAAKFRDRFKSIQHKASFVNWLRSKGAFTSDSEAEAEAQVLLMETYEFVESDSVQSTFEHIKYLKDEARHQPIQSKISDEFRDRYADCIALIERVSTSLE